jgi:hypothetical protein
LLYKLPAILEENSLLYTYKHGKCNWKIMSNKNHEHLILAHLYFNAIDMPVLRVVRSKLLLRNTNQYQTAALDSVISVSRASQQYLHKQGNNLTFFLLRTPPYLRCRPTHGVASNANQATNVCMRLLLLCFCCPVQVCDWGSHGVLPNVQKHEKREAPGCNGLWRQWES